MKTFIWIIVAIAVILVALLGGLFIYYKIKSIVITTKEKNKRRRNLNDDIQGTFWGLSFGDSVQEMSNKFDHIFQIEKCEPYQNDKEGCERYQVKKIDDKVFSFENLEWTYMTVSFFNNRFYSIHFVSDTDIINHSVKVPSFDEVLNEFSKKYKLNIKEKGWDSRYQSAFAESKNNKKLTISCHQGIMALPHNGVRVLYSVEDCSVTIEDESFSPSR